MLFFNKLQKYRVLIISLLFIGVIALVTKQIAHSGYRLTYSTTLSMPKGFYLIKPFASLKHGDIVEFYPPVAIRDFLKQKHWAPRSGLLLKHVYGIPEDFVCTQNNFIFINGAKIAPIYKFYAPGKKLPQISLCRKLNQDEYFLLSTTISNSFDSRYFGPVSRKDIVGEASFLFR